MSAGVKKGILWALGLIVVTGAGVGVRSHFTGRAPEQHFETVKADRGSVVAKITATGTLSALVTVQVGSQVSGRLQEIDVDFNSAVKKGEVIAKLDAQLFQAALEQARANFAAARGNLAKAKVQAVDAQRQLERTRSLAERKLIAQADLDTAQTNADAAAAQVEVASGSVEQSRAALHQAEVNLAYTTILSPINGIVVSRNVDVGQTVAASLQSPTLFVIAEDLRKMQVDTSVAEADVGKLQPGLTTSFLVDAYPGEKFAGRVRQIRNSPQTVQNIVTYDAVIDVENPELKLKPGMTANVTFVFAQKDEVVRVPNAALRFRPSPELLAIRGAAGNGGRGGRHAMAGGLPGGGTGLPGAPGGHGGPPGSRRGPGAGGVSLFGGRGDAEAATLAHGEDPSRADRRGTPPDGQLPSPGEPTGGGTGLPAPAGEDQAAPPPAAPAAFEANRRTVWVLRNGQPRPVVIHTGISDGTLTELTDGEIGPGDELITDVTAGVTAGAFGGGGGGHGGGRPFRMF